LLFLAEIICETRNISQKQNQNEFFQELSNSDSKFDLQSLQLRGELSAELLKFLTLLLKAKHNNSDHSVSLYESACFYFLSRFVKVLFQLSSINVQTYFGEKTRSEHDTIFEVIANGIGANHPQQIITYIIENVCKSKF
jgi:hypothetical protein